MAITLHRNYLKEPKPEVVFPVTEVRNGDPKFEIRQLPDKDWVRVFPMTAEDVFFLQCLVMHGDKFAPATGHGVILASRCLDL
jgi:hypothetical protein